MKHGASAFIQVAELKNDVRIETEIPSLHGVAESENGL